MVWTGPLDLDPDPRISTQRPAWLSARSDWSDTLACMSREDVRWLDKQWRMATAESSFTELYFDPDFLR